MTQTLLSARNVTRRFGGLVAIDNVSVDLDRGQV
ncbi:MAG: ABC transporter ATP-binding protein, partial [Pusillimonas sp.]|nr:ABC transporter ATP-binding protein [Pusillimonas sp.]